MSVELTITVPEADQAVAFEPYCDAGTYSLVFGVGTTIRLVGSADALANLIETLRDTLANACEWTARGKD